MTPKDEELMNRYIYQVTRRIPKEQRREVGLELQELIGDMKEETDSMEEVLTSLGNPAEFAGKYHNAAHCLIGPEYYDTYLWFLKIVLLCTLISVLGASIVSGITKGADIPGNDSISSIIAISAEGIANIIMNLVISCMGAFGGVTLVFAIMERQKIKFDLKEEKEWSVSDLGDNFISGKGAWTPKFLAPIPHKKALISRGDSITGIVFTVIFCILLIFAPEFFAAVFRENGTVTRIPMFNLEKWNLILPFFILSLLAGLADEVLRLVVGCYCKLVMTSKIVCSIFQMLLSFLVLKVFPFWNPGFPAEVQAHFSGSTDKAELFMARWNNVFASNAILALIVVITLADICVTVYKTYRYGVNPQPKPEA